MVVVVAVPVVLVLLLVVVVVVVVVAAAPATVGSPPLDSIFLTTWLCVQPLPHEASQRTLPRPSSCMLPSSSASGSLGGRSAERPIWVSSSLVNQI